MIKGRAMASNGRLRQERKIQEIGEALVAEGLTTLGKQAAALGPKHRLVYSPSKATKGGHHHGNTRSYVGVSAPSPVGSAEGIGIRG
jgi:hypothetical protein